MLLQSSDSHLFSTKIQEVVTCYKHLGCKKVRDHVFSYSTVLEIKAKSDCLNKRSDAHYKTVASFQHFH